VRAIADPCQLRRLAIVKTVVMRRLRSCQPRWWMVNEGEPGVGLCQRVIRLGFGDVVDVDGIYIDNRYARPRTNQLGPKPTRQ